MAQGRRRLETALSLLDSVASVHPRTVLIDDMRAEWRELDPRIVQSTPSSQERATDGAQRLTTIPGIGPLNATALVAAVGNAQTSPVDVTSRPGSGWCRDR